MLSESRIDLLLSRWEDLRARGCEVAPEALAPQDAALQAELARRIAGLKSMEWLDREVPTATLPPPDDPALPGPNFQLPKTLAGRYQLEKLIASGGFGQVWRAQDAQLLREVAVKITTIDCLDEARRVARLKHPGIVPVHDVGRDDGFCFIVFDLIEGTTLAARIAGKLPQPQEAAHWVKEIAERLEYARSQGIVHRDIKPANILLDESGKLYLADFGIAAEAEAPLDEREAAAGTLAYMAPERLDGTLATADARTDIYSLGVVLYQLLTGRLPFAGDTPLAMRQAILTGKPLAIERPGVPVPADLARITFKCLARERGARFATAGELAAALAPHTGE